MKAALGQIGIGRGLWGEADAEGLYLIDKSDRFGFTCRLDVTVTIQRELLGLSKHSKIK